MSVSSPACDAACCLATMMTNLKAVHLCFGPGVSPGNLPESGRAFVALSCGALRGGLSLVFCWCAFFTLPRYYSSMFPRWQHLFRLSSSAHAEAVLCGTSVDPSVFVPACLFASSALFTVLRCHILDHACFFLQLINTSN